MNDQAIDFTETFNDVYSQYMFFSTVSSEYVRELYNLISDKEEVTVTIYSNTGDKIQFTTDNPFEAIRQYTASRIERRKDTSLKEKLFDLLMLEHLVLNIRKYMSYAPDVNEQREAVLDDAYYRAVYNR